MDQKVLTKVEAKLEAKRRRASRKEDMKDDFHIMLKKNLQTTSKQLVWLFSFFGVIWISCSYVLAFMGQEQIAESLSSNVCTVVIGQLAFYLVTKTVENVFKFNTSKVFGESNPNALAQDGVNFSSVDTKNPVVPEPICPEPPTPDVRFASAEATTDTTTVVETSDETVVGGYR